MLILKPGNVVPAPGRSSGFIATVIVEGVGTLIIDQVFESPVSAKMNMRDVISASRVVYPEDGEATLIF